MYFRLFPAFVQWTALLLMTAGLAAPAAAKSEAHLQLCGVTPERAAQALGVGESATERFSVAYLDTAKLDLFRKAIILRVIRERTEAKVDLKLRPFDEDSLSDRWQNDDDVRCERDVYRAKATPACRLRDEVDREAVDAVFAGTSAPGSLVGDDAEELAFEAKDVDLPRRHLLVYGPVRVQRWASVHVPGIDEGAVLEGWALGDGTVITELSAKTASDQGTGALQRLVARAKGAGLTVCTTDRSKTAQVLGAPDPGDGG